MRIQRGDDVCQPVAIDIRGKHLRAAFVFGEHKRVRDPRRAAFRRLLPLESRIIGEVDYTSAFSTLHEKAIYLHQGQQYYVHQLDIPERRAYVKRVDSDYFTDAITYTKVKILETMDTAAEHNHGEVHVAHQVVGFKKLKFFTMENTGSGDLNLPV